MRRTTMSAVAPGARRWLPAAVGAALLMLLVVLFVTLQPDTTPADPAAPTRARATPEAEAPAPSAEVLPAGDPGEPSALRGEAFSFACPIRDVADGPLGFVRLETYGPGARKLGVARGELAGESDVIEGEGDLVRGGEPVARLRWHETSDGAVGCETVPVPLVEITGAVVDVRGVPVPEAVVVGCGGRVTADGDGRFGLTASEGRACKVRAQQLGRAPAASPAVDVIPPAEVTLEVERRTIEDVRTEVGREVALLTALDQVDQQRAAALHQPPDEVSPEVTARRERLQRLEAALASEDPDAVLQEWLGE